MDTEARPQAFDPTDTTYKPKQDVADRDQTGADLAITTPALLNKRRQSARKPKYLTPRDAIWNIVGMDKSKGGPTDVSSNKHYYLSKAYLHERD